MITWTGIFNLKRRDPISDHILCQLPVDETDCISHSTNTIGKGMNLIILPQAMDK